MKNKVRQKPHKYTPRVAHKTNFCYYIIMNSNEMKQRLIEAYPDADQQQDIQVHDLTGTSDHWEVFVRSEVFKGLSRVEQHQHVMKAFGPELKTGEVHALSIKTSLKLI